MIPETSAATAALMAAVSAATMAVFGVDYYSLLWALVGAMLAVTLSEKMSRGRAIVYVLLSMLVGAVLGNVVGLRFEHAPKVLLNALCALGGITAQGIASALLAAAPRVTDAIVRKIEARLGGGGNA